MRTRSWIITCCLAILQLSCQHGEKGWERDMQRVGTETADPYAKVYTYAAYLSTSEEVEVEEAISMINEMIAYGYFLEARYSINNMMDHGIRSFDLLALRGLCYLNENRPELARRDLETALKGDPGNPKIKVLLDQVEGGNNSTAILNGMLDRAMNRLSMEAFDEADSILDVILEMDEMFHRALFSKGLIRIQQEQYDSARFFLSFASSIAPADEYRHYLARLERLREGEDLVRADPDSFRGYLVQSEALSAIGQYGRAQRMLDRGLARQPDHLNLILAKALVWVQAGQTETARQYLWEQQQRGIAIDADVMNQILQTDP